MDSGLVLLHQDISSHNADQYLIMALGVFNRRVKSDTIFVSPKFDICYTLMCAISCCITSWCIEPQLYHSWKHICCLYFFNALTQANANNPKRSQSIGTVNYSQKHGSRAGEASKTTGSGYRSASAPGCSLLTVDSIVYSDIVNTFKSSHLHSILSIAIIETPECQHCIVWQWTAFWSRGNGKFPTIKQRKFDFNGSSYRL